MSNLKANLKLAIGVDSRPPTGGRTSENTLSAVVLSLEDFLAVIFGGIAVA